MLGSTCHHPFFGDYTRKVNLLNQYENSAFPTRKSANQNFAILRRMVTHARATTI